MHAFRKTFDESLSEEVANTMVKAANREKARKARASKVAQKSVQQLLAEGSIPEGGALEIREKTVKGCAANSIQVRPASHTLTVPCLPRVCRASGAQLEAD